MLRIDKDPTLKTSLLQEALKARGLYTGEVDNWPGTGTNEALAAYVAQMTPAKTGLQVTRWNAAFVRAAKRSEVESVVTRILTNRSRYEAVAVKTGVPWWVIAALHNMESSGSFKRHLHEGSLLTGRTKDVPKGRPLVGSPPFTWEESAVDALTYDKMAAKNWTSLEASLQAAELYNGSGYQTYHPAVPSPYLWAGTSIETPGKYVGDGKWSGTATSDQIGVAAIWKELQAQGAAVLPG